MFRRKSLWRWRHIKPSPIRSERLAILPDPTARPTTGFVSNFINTQLDRFGWQTVIVVRPVFSDTGEIFSGSYKVGFLKKPDGKDPIAMRCTKKLRGPIGLLVGPDPVEFFITRHSGYTGSPRLELVERTTRSKLNPSIPLI